MPGAPQSPPTPGASCLPGPPRWTPFLAAFLALCLYAPTLGHGFVNTDRFFVVSNPAIRAEGTPWRFFTDPTTQAVSSAWYADRYRPFLTWSFALNYAFGGLDPFGYHLVNVLLHVLAVLLVFYVARMWTRGGWPALAAAALFAVHPLNTEAVAWVSARSQVLLAVFALLALLLHTRQLTLGGFGRLAAQLGVLVSFGLALLSSEAAVALPLVLFLAQVLLPGDRPSTKVTTGAYYVAIVTVLASYVLLRRWVTGLGPLADLANDPGRALMASADAVLYYVRLFLLPVGLSIEHPLEGSPVVPVVALAIGMLAAAVVLHRRAPRVSFALLWFLVWVGAVGPLFVSRSQVPESCFYPAGFGLALLFGLAAQALVGREAEHRPLARLRRGAAMAGTMMIAATLAALTVHRCPDWRDDLALLTSQERTGICTAGQHAAMGEAYYQQGKPDFAVQEFHKALSVDPGMAAAHWGLAVVRMDRKEFARAHDELSLAAESDPNLPGLAAALGKTALLTGELEDGLRWLQRAVNLEPYSARLKEELENTHLAAELFGEAQGCERDGDWAGAESLCREVVATQPWLAVGHLELARAMRAQKDFVAARSVYDDWLTINPDSADGHNDLAWLLITAPEPPVRDPAAAVEHARRAHELRPDQLDYVHALAWALVANGQPDEAQKLLEEHAQTQETEPMTPEWLLEGSDGRMDEQR